MSSSPRHFTAASELFLLRSLISFTATRTLGPRNAGLSPSDAQFSKAPLGRLSPPGTTTPRGRRLAGDSAPT